MMLNEEELTIAREHYFKGYKRGVDEAVKALWDLNVGSMSLEAALNAVISVSKREDQL